MDDCANKIVVGTRGSNLAITQTKWVIDQLQTSYPNANFEIKTIQTKGDLHLDKDLDKIGDKGLFVKEIEQQLLNKDIDMAVHSMKDMPTAATQGLALSSVFKREDVRDALVLRGGGTGKIADLPLGAKIGTGSKRRKYQLLKLRPDLNVVSIRGNVDTRIEKMQKEKLDGIILAAAGLKRIGREAEIGEYIDTTAMVPAVGQGALVAQTRETDTELAKMLDYIKDEKANVQITAERAFLKEIGGSCHLPSGAYAKIEKDHIFLTGFYGDSEGKVLVKKTIVGKVSEPSVLGAKLAKEILAEFTQDEQDEK
ncbi:MAG: hydroxymethylbilane synthase [Defluviitaleaceae bacterium]|nr:hydroxymethylbilane synthase [Defluviitaleaceae bacterium]